MSEYSCFLHPTQKGSALDELCPQCGLPYHFPLTDPPRELNGKLVTRALNRGFYGAVYQTVHPKTRRSFAVKVVPVKTYAPASEGGLGKPSFEEEATTHLALSDSPVIAALQDYGDELVRFGAHEIDCHWMEMEYIEGRTLADIIASAPESPREVAQIAIDLLDLIGLLQQRHRYHNDLHGENIVVVSLTEMTARRDAIHPRISVKTLDLGSAADQTKSGPERLGDVHWVAAHILDLLNAFERTHPEMEPATLRLNAQLRRVAEYYSGADRDRAPTPSDMKASVHDAYSFGERPLSHVARLASIGEHYNAQSLPPLFANELLYDPGGRWAKRLTGAGPQLLTGMRGCGKTMLMRSLEWPARVPLRDGETPAKRLGRLRKDAFLGLFVSCAALLRGPRAAALDVPVHRLFLAYAREVVRDVQYCEAAPVGEVDYNALGAFASLISGIIPWFTKPADTGDPVSLERRLSEALQTPANGGRVADFAPRVAFDEFARATRRITDLWEGRTLLFLLDDVSSRYLAGENVEELLSQLSLQSPEFGFKISTENQTLGLETPGGAPARSGRDYATFDLGAEVFAKFDGKAGVRFLEEVLDRRARITDGAPTNPAGDILGHQDLLDLARAIREGQGKDPVYWGIEALAGVCTGDIGDILQLYESVLDRGRDAGFPIPAAIQHKAFTDYCDAKLLHLAGRDGWLYSHAVAFAEASHRELRKSIDERLRQYGSIFVKIDPREAEELFPRVIQLIDAGVFVFTGGTPRRKVGQRQPILLFKLAYRKVLGLTNAIPLSKKDRFEPPGSQLREWLLEPSSDKLQVARGAPRAAHEGEEAHSPAGHPEVKVVRQEQAKIDLSTKANRGAHEELPEPRTLYEVATLFEGAVADSPVEWNTVHIIGAFGFEERSEGAWANLLSDATPAGATLLRYDDPGRAEAICLRLTEQRIPFRESPTGSTLTVAEIDRLLAEDPNGFIAVDTTSLTKALIYLLVWRSLLSRSQVLVLHTCAESYYPPDTQLDEVVRLFDSGQFLDAFKTLDAMVAGERGPYKTITVAEERRDPSAPSVMAAFVSLKHDRLAHLLEDVTVQEVAAIAPVHTAGPTASRSVAGRRLADHIVQVHGGKRHSAGTLDHQDAYHLLTELHDLYALRSGYNFELALSGAKMHAVAAGMLAATALPAGVYYSAPSAFDPSKFTAGTGVTRVVQLVRRQRETGPDV